MAVLVVKSFFVNMLFTPLVGIPYTIVKISQYRGTKKIDKEVYHQPDNTRTGPEDPRSTMWSSSGVR